MLIVIIWTAEQNSVGMKELCDGESFVIPHYEAGGVAEGKITLDSM